MRTPLLISCMLLSSVCLCFSSGCRRAPTPTEDTQAKAYTGTLAAIKAAGQLRVLVRPDPISRIPRSATTVTLERDLAAQLASALNVELVLLSPEQHDDLIPWLLEGKADLIAAELTVTEQRLAQVAFSVPYRHTDQVLVTRNDLAIGDWDSFEASSLSICIRPSSSYAATLAALTRRPRALHILSASEDQTTEQLIESVAAGRCEATLADRVIYESARAYLDNIDAALTMAKQTPIALAMSAQAPQLKSWVDKYLFAHALTGHRREIYHDDLDGLERRKVIRMITRNGAHSYFIYKGMQLGFDFELFTHFAKQLGLRIEVVVPPRAADMLSWLQEGRGDIVAASLAITEQRLADPNVAWARPYLSVTEMIVLPDSATDINSVDDLNAAGLGLNLRPSSSYFQRLDGRSGVIITAADEGLTTSELIQQVATGEIEATVADSHIVQIEQAYGTKVHTFALSDDQIPLGWAVRSSNPRLLAAINAFFAREYRGLTYNLLRRKYFESTRVAGLGPGELRADRNGVISPYDELFKKYAQLHGLDWRLIAALAYHESRFDPKAVSWVGARGLMQLMPNTAIEVGVRDSFAPADNIRGGVTYLARMLNRFPPDIPFKDRVRFALASYNAGYGHVLDARRIAAQLELDPNRWFHNVEKAMLLLEQPRWHRRSRYGYCRGSEPVAYVSRIQSRYDAFVEHTADAASDI